MRRQAAISCVSFSDLPDHALDTGDAVENIGLEYTRGRTSTRSCAHKDCTNRLDENQQVQIKRHVFDVVEVEG